MKGEIRSYLPPRFYSLIASAYWVVNPKKQTRLIYPKKVGWEVWTKNSKYYTYGGEYDRGSPEWRKHKFERYSLDGFCTVDPGDLVVDVGAFIGEYSLPASQVADKVISIEADPTTFKVLKKQTDDIDNIDTHNRLLGGNQEQVTFNSSSDPSESSILTPDKGEINTIEMEQVPLDTILQKHQVDHADFIKMDAEGAEVEVLNGIEKISVSKFAIDVGSEREGESTRESVQDILTDRGYEIKVRSDENNDPILFAVD